MALSRRSVLRNLGAISAVQTFAPLNHCFGSQSAISETGPSPDSVLVLFEGPWLISDVKTGPHKGDLMAICVGDPHACQMGLWNSTSKADNPPLLSPLDPELEAASLANDAVFRATRMPAKLNSCTTVFDKTFHQPNPDAPPTDSFVYIRKKKLEPKKMAGDRVIYIPVPDSVHVAGQVPFWPVTDNTPEKLVENPSAARMYITVILEYKATKARPTALSFSDDSGSRFEVKSSHARRHLIFRLVPGSSTMANDADHIKAAFGDLVQRLLPATPNAIAVTPGSLQVVIGPSAAGLSANELGIAKEDIVASVQAPKPGGIRPMFLDFPSCQGGGLVNCE